MFALSYTSPLNGPFSNALKMKPGSQGGRNIVVCWSLVPWVQGIEMSACSPHNRRSSPHKWFLLSLHSFIDRSHFQHGHTSIRPCLLVSLDSQYLTDSYTQNQNTCYIKNTATSLWGTMYCIFQTLSIYLMTSYSNQQIHHLPPAMLKTASVSPWPFCSHATFISYLLPVNSPTSHRQ